MTRRIAMRQRLLIGLMFAMLLIWLLVLILVYRGTAHEVEEIFDADLARSARMFSVLIAHQANDARRAREKLKHALKTLDGNSASAFLNLADELDDHDDDEDEHDEDELDDREYEAAHKYESKLVILARYADGRVLLGSPGVPDFPLTARGYFDYADGDRAWRGFGLSDANSGFILQVGERREIRRGLVENIIRNLLPPILISLPFLAIAIWLGVGRGLRPLDRVASELDGRAAQSLRPMRLEDAPVEVAPLIQAINGLFQRVQDALESERRFTADAAHELRTPLAALKTQVQVALNDTDDARTRDRLQQVSTAVDRAAHLVEQLLTLARADASPRSGYLEQSVDLRQVAIDNLSGLAEQALTKQIDLGLEADRPVLVYGEAAALGILLRNLVDNALRYCPAGSQVTVRVTAHGIGGMLVVDDDGPGVPRADRARLLGRFQRGATEQADDHSGSGLGLSIVQRIAELHGAKVQLSDGPHGRGLSIQIYFPNLAETPDRPAKITNL